MKSTTKRAPALIDGKDAETLARLGALALVVVTAGGTLGLAVRVFVWASGLGG